MEVHVYNRGVDKRRIFYRFRDYEIFLSKVARFLPDLSLDLLSYCLMPNHFHLLIAGITNWRDLSKFMQKFGTSYVMYFNKRYNRVGHLFQNTYKFTAISDGKHLLDTSGYIHRNPIKLNISRNWAHAIESYPWSSYRYYVGDHPPSWLNKDKILKEFGESNFISRYKTFVETGEFLAEDIL